MVKMSPNLDQVIRCTQVNCTCQCFRPAKNNLRICDHCRHGWVVHALDKLFQPAQHLLSATQVEVAHPGVVFDLASLVLYGATALPIRLKILLDRLLSVLTRDQNSSGSALDRWTVVCHKEEIVTLQQFLRFGETRTIVELMTFQDSLGNDLSGPSSSRTDSDVQAFIESNGRSGHFETGSPAVLNHFHNFPASLSMLLPFQFHSPSPLQGLAPPTRLGGLRSPGRVKRSKGPQRQSESSVSESLSVSPYGNLVSPVPAAVNGLGGEMGNGTGTTTMEPKPKHNESPTRSSSRQPNRDHDQRQPAGNRDDQRPHRRRPGYLVTNPERQKKNFRLSKNDSSNTSCLSKLAQSLFRVVSHPSSSSSLRNDRLFPDVSFPLRSSSLPKGWLFPQVSPSLRKGRVCCGACDKSFYDKGTLKIHYNAVHLKIKHRCTVDGCSMVFSSLRSRNRHSANPNPRLHMDTLRHAPHKDREAAHTHTWSQHTHTWSQHTHTCDKPHKQQGPHNIATAVPPNHPQHPQQQHTPLTHPSNPTLAPHPEPDKPSSPDPYRRPIFPRTGHPSVGITAPLSSFQTQLLVSSLGEVQPLSQFYRATRQTSPIPSFSSLFDQLASSSGSMGGAKALGSSNQGGWCTSADPAPKKKPRKSSMPLKMEKTVTVSAEECRGERGRGGGRRREEEEEVIGQGQLNRSLGNEGLQLHKLFRNRDSVREEDRMEEEVKEEEEEGTDPSFHSFNDHMFT